MKKTAPTGLKDPGKKAFGFGKAGKNPFFQFLLFLLVFFCFSPLYGADDPQRSPIDINLIIDGSASLTNVKGDVTAWVSSRLDQILADGDRVTVWSAGASAKVVYSGRISGAPDRDAVKKAVRDLAAAGNSADFSGALREAAGRQSSGYSYTLLISASPAALSSLISGPQSDLMRFSRIEEFSGWRAIVVGLNLDSKVKKAAADYFGS
ncbi:MAG: VWA domain-containing protein [Treponema sp.]|jgi:hypothetical protein|nr:VWA domain-containing protein [Treponema sp.]